MKRAAFASLAAVAAYAAPAIARAQNLPTVRIGTFPAESYSLPIYAKEQGFFARNGINADVQYIPTASGGITAALVGGALDVGCISMGPTSNAHLRGIPIRLIAPGGIILSEQSTTSLLVAKNSSINSAKDLNGKTVATFVLRDVVHVAEAKWIDVNGGDSKTVKFVELNLPESQAALAGGRIDAAALSEPLLTNVKGDFKDIGHIYDAISRRMMISMHIAMADWLDKNTDTARRVVTAMRQAAQWANANKPATHAILSRETKIPLDVVNRMNHVVFGETLDVAMIQPQIDALFEYKFIERRYNVADIIWPGAR